jgi:hypothetical protein
MARSDVTITRSGGATSMELLQLHNADLPKRKNKFTLIHAEAEKSLEYRAKIDSEIARMKTKDKYKHMKPTEMRSLATEKVLCKEGIVLWEAGNAKYLQEKIGAHVVIPEYSIELLENSFCS